MDPTIGAIIAKALDGLTLRYTAVAQNVANAGSPGYRPVRVSFEGALRAASGQGAGAVRRLALGMTADSRFVPGQEFRIDLEIAEAAQTSMRYAALIDALGRRMAITRAAVGGGQ